jgi:hypothetical protein
MTESIVRMEIEEAIASIKNEKHKKFLSQFKNEHEDSEILVTEHKDNFEVIVKHPFREHKTGGSEQYFIDKETGNAQMGWHKHPMPFPGSERQRKGE